MKASPVVVTLALLCFAFSLRALGEDFDADDRSQRVLLLLPQGPLVVELLLSIDERPYLHGTEALLDGLLADADANQDGVLLWKELTSARSLLGQAMFDIANNDLNGNGIAEKNEARLAFTMFIDASFFVQGQAFLGGPDGSQLQQLLDIDGNGALSDEELDAAPARLRARDADDNEIITTTEIVGAVQPDLQQNARALATAETIFGLDAEIDFSRIHAVLAQRYGKDGRLPVAPFKLMRAAAAELDTNDDDAISREEFPALLTIAPPLVLDVSLGTRTRLRETVIVTSMCDELQRIARVDRTADGKLVLDFISIKIEVQAPNPKPTPRTFAGQATSYMANFDKDQNGYLEPRELAGTTQAAQFETWDTDRDGKVFAAELRAALERADAPNWQKISVAALSQGNNLFTVLDTNGDRQLGMREVQDAAEKLRGATLDQQDTLRLAIARGAETYKYLSKNTKPFSPRRSESSAAANGPEWFIHMDTNADGDITRREFLGAVEQFDKLDTNADGVLEANELP